MGASVVTARGKLGMIAGGELHDGGRGSCLLAAAAVDAYASGRWAERAAGFAAPGVAGEVEEGGAGGAGGVLCHVN